MIEARKECFLLHDLKCRPLEKEMQQVRGIVGVIDPMNRDLRNELIVCCKK